MNKKLMDYLKNRAISTQFSHSAATTSTCASEQRVYSQCSVSDPVGPVAPRTSNRLASRTGIPASNRTTFGSIATDWLERELLDPIVVKPKAHTTLYCYQHITNDYSVPKWGECVAEEIEPVDIEIWLAGLSVDKKGSEGLHWDTLNKIRSVMKQIYAHGQRTKLIPKNPEANPFRPAD